MGEVDTRVAAHHAAGNLPTAELRALAKLVELPKRNDAQ